MMRPLLYTASITLLSLVASGQPGSFEVATVRPAAPAPTPGGQASASGDTLVFRNTTLSNVLVRAFEITFGNQLAGPSWAFTERYDIVAKTPANTPQAQIPPMLRTLLMERFKLMVHHETRDLPMYALVVGKGRLALKAVENQGAGKDSASFVNGHREFRNMSMDGLSGLLSQMLRTPVLDQTGLSGTYNFTMDLSLEELGGVSNLAVTAPSIFTIVEELGLKLESGKAPFDVLVIDGGEKVPAEN
jgi:uncharacterized protein (TIGR03435 family)